MSPWLVTLVTLIHPLFWHGCCVVRWVDLWMQLSDSNVIDCGLWFEQVKKTIWCHSFHCFNEQKPAVLLFPDQVYLITLIPWPQSCCNTCCGDVQSSPEKRLAYPWCAEYWLMVSKSNPIGVFQVANCGRTSNWYIAFTKRCLCCFCFIELPWLFDATTSWSIVGVFNHQVVSGWFDL